MKGTFNRNLKRTIAFVSALVVLSSAVAVTAFADQAEGVQKSDTVTKYVDDYTKLFPGLKDAKLKLRDPKFSDKEWYEYIDYDFYSEVVDGDMTYRIYQPTDIGQASIMAIGDYNPKEVLGNTPNLAMNLGELQGILDMAAQGGNISKDFAGLNIASGIASSMSSIDKVMDNSKYYSQSSFLGIPGDKKYTGVSNDGFYNADSLEIEITETETITACKTIAMDSTYSVSESTVNGKESNTYSELSDGVSNTIEESNYEENSATAGQTIGVATSDSQEISQSITDAIGWEIVSETSSSYTKSHTDSSGNEAGGGFEVGAEGKAGVPFVAEGKVSASVNGHYNHTWGHEDEESWSVSDSLAISQSGSTSVETGQSFAHSLEQSVEQNIEASNTTGKSSGKSESIEHSMTSGSGSGVNYSHAKDMSVELGYGVDYQYGNEHSLSVGVNRTFNAREDDEVKNVGWKLCEYIVKVPYYIEAIKTDAAGEETVLYGQYVNYNLLNGVCRVFANGYIEHWYTGKLVTYADFFDGFITATELVDKAKAQQAQQGQKEG